MSVKSLSDARARPPVSPGPRLGVVNVGALLPSHIVLVCQMPFIYSRLGLFLQCLITSIFVIVLPGQWMFPLAARLFRGPGKRDTGPMATPSVVVAYLWTSLVLLVGIAAGRYVLAAVGLVHAPFTAWSFWAAYAVVIEACVVRCLLTRTSPLLPTVPGGHIRATAATIMAAAFGLTAWGASHVVPPQQDQDMVLVCPTWGLYHDLLPLGLESRMPYQFNKPPAFYFFTGASVILRGDVELARPFYDSSRRAVLALKTADRFPKGLIHRLREENIALFFATPRLTESVRVIIPGFAGLLAGVIFLLLVDHGVSVRVAALMALASVAVPEMFIRFSCADFTSPSLLIMVLLMWRYFQDDDSASRPQAALCWASALLALTNHKALLVVPAYLLGDLARAGGSGSTKSTLSRWAATVWRRGIVLGALAGTLAYWIYGMAVNPHVFFADHLQRDFLWRLSGRIDPTYPSLTGVWLQWLRNTAFVAIPLGVVCLGVLVAKGGRRYAAVALWFVIGAVLASLTDWKQTKHLMLALPPLLLAPGLVWQSCTRRVRNALVVLVCGSLAASGYFIYRLWIDFSFLTPSKVW